MAPMALSSPKTSDDNFPVEELIFSCTICQATVSEVYATIESNHGFHNGSGDEDGIVTKMWIADCSHITCAKHLDNGAAPFHPRGMAPRAPCPKCVQDGGDDTLRELYSIRGLGDGECDYRIPNEWRQCPAMRLDSSVEGMEAVRFQYMALAHYSRQMRKHAKACQQKQLAAEVAHSKERKQRRQLQSELLELKSKVEALEKSEGKLKLWESRKPAINHYLSIIGPMAKDIERMGGQLMQLGFDVPKRQYAFNPELQSQAPPRYAHDVQSINEGVINNIPAPGGHVSTDPDPNSYEGSSSSRKRKREEHDIRDHCQAGRQSYPSRSDSRDIMPPPLPKVDQRQKNVLQRRETTQPETQGRHSVQVYEADAWNPSQANHVHHHQELDQYSQSRSDPAHSYGKPPVRPTSAHHSQFHNLAPRHHGSEMNHGLQEPNFEYMRNGAYLERPADAQRPLQARQTFQRSLRSSAEGTSQTDRHNAPKNNPNGERHSDHTSDGRHRQQQSIMSRAPLQPISASFQNQQQLVSSQPFHSYSASMHRSHQAPVTSVISPFFKQGGADPRPPTVQRPPTCGSFVQQSHASSATIQHLTANQNPFMSTAAQQSPSLSRSLNGLSFIEKPHRPNHLPMYSPLQQSYDASFRSQHPSGIPHAPRNSQGLFQRPDRNMAGAHYVASRPQQSPHRSRVSLVPTRGPPVSMATSQDNAISQIRGVRGVSSQRGFSSYQNLSQSNQMARSLYSSAGGRRSVRR